MAQQQLHIDDISAVVLLVTALGILWLQAGDSDRRLPDRVYFFDLETNEVFAHASRATPPIEAPSGGRGVRAYLYTCGECTPDQWLGRLETYSEEAKQMLEDEGEFLDGPRHHLVRDLRGGPWVPYESGEAMDIMERAVNPCLGDENRFPEDTPCLP